MLTNNNTHDILSAEGKPSAEVYKMGKRGMMRPESFDKRLQMEGGRLTRLTAKRLSRGITQKELANMTGLQQAYIAGLENSTRNINNITVTNLRRLASALDCSMESLLEQESATKSATG